MQAWIQDFSRGGGEKIYVRYKYIGAKFFVPPPYEISVVLGFQRYTVNTGIQVLF